MSEVPRVIDNVSYRISEVGGLESKVPILTQAGKNTLHDLVIHVPGDIPEIQARQEAIEELGEKPELQEALTEKIDGFSRFEGYLYDFQQNGFPSVFSYLGASRAVRQLQNLGRTTEKLGDSAPESSFLREHLEVIEEFNQTNLGGMLRGPVYYTSGGLKSKDSLGRFEPRLRFRSSFSGRLLLLSGVALIPAELGAYPPEAVTIPMLASAWFGIMYHVPLPAFETSIKDVSWNRGTVYDPLRKNMEGSEEYKSALASVGSLDVITALNGLRKTISDNGHSTVLPRIESGDIFHFKATGLKNPMLAVQEDRNVVANDLEFGGSNNRLTFITGPNSGGKSTLSKAVIQNVILGQIGGAMVAESATMTPADKIAYHVPMPPNLDADTGRLGFELGRVRAIIDDASPRSLSVLDDCLDGTTHEERVQILKNVMLAFKHLGGATIFSTHAHELVGDFEETDDGQFLQVEFDGEAPTYRLVPGVSHTSHAARVAREYGFSEEQIRDELKSQGITI